ncbi:hypothetical protein GCQ56_07700 [Marinifilum sp. N1E240]|uniref:HK97 family phage prohead protease n=1 Tax=Marinifilum sp. N1E240 TaxID=2608082 RepID=UPI00128DA8DC|nr:HK97 family phage prohead protease [Marinifilum sp. N1E240]MPQ46897.1 hypothetical protein [Marinifilum sp. N1E240]
MSKEKQIRSLTTTITAPQNDKDEWILEGRFITYNSASKYMGFYEKVVRGAVHIKRDIIMTSNHIDGEILGRQRNSTLVLFEKDDGYYYRCQLNKEDPQHQSVYAKAKREDLYGNSFEFFEDEDQTKIEYDENGIEVRTIHYLELLAVNIVVNPAYVDSFAKARSEVITEQKEKKKEVRTFMKIDEMKQKRAEVITKMEALETKAEKENRELEENEVKERNELLTQSTELGNKIDNQIAINKEKARSFEDVKIEGEPLKNKRNEMTNWTLPNSDDKKVRSIPTSMFKKERAQSITDNPQVTQSNKSLATSLYPEQLLNKLGVQVTFEPQMVEKVVANRLTGVAGFKGENEAGDNKSVTFRTVVLRARKIPFDVLVGKRFVREDIVGATAQVIQESKVHLEESIEAELFSATVRGEKNPGGLFAMGTAVDHVSAGVNYQAVLGWRKKLAEKHVNVGKAKFVTSYLMDNTMRGEAIDAGSGKFLLEGDTITNTGVKVLASPFIQDDTALMGDFSHVLVNFFENATVEYDPYTYMGTSQVRYHFEVEVDWNILHQEAILAITNILA